MAGETILIVEDNELNIKLVQATLGRHGYQLHVVMDGATALTRAAELRPDLILMDINLPDPLLNGLEVTRRLRQDPAMVGVVIVALTAAAMKEDEVRSRAAGCDGHITKPIDVRSFPATIASYLGARRR